MKIRIAIWATLGALVVVAWTIYISATFSHPLGNGSVGRNLIHLTVPISLAGEHHPQSFYFVLLANAATYALAGIAVEMMRRYYTRSNLNLN